MLTSTKVYDNINYKVENNNIMIMQFKYFDLDYSNNKNVITSSKIFQYIYEN